MQVLQISNSQGDVSNQWNHSPHPMNLACTAIYFAQTLIGHGVLVSVLIYFLDRRSCSRNS